jgi:capsid protein
MVERRIEEHNAKMECFRAAVRSENARVVTYNRAMEQTKKAVDTMVAAGSKAVMSLNDELYGANNRPYNSELWQSNAAVNRRVSRIAHSQSPAAQALTGRFADLVYGPYLGLQSQPFFDAIPGAPKDIEARTSIIKNIETRYWLWAKSTNAIYEKDRNYYLGSRQDFERLLIDGEYLLILRYSQSRKRNPLTIQTIKAENIQRVGSPVATGNTECDGIEYDSTGAAVAYHVLDSSAGKSTRVMRYGAKSGRTFAIHVKLGDGKRGIGLLAGIISELTKLSDFQALEIQAAVINALFAVWVETPIGGENKALTNKRGINGIGKTIDENASAFSPSEFNAKLNSTDYQHGGIIVEKMGEGQKLNSFDTKRPTANFEQFFNAVKRNLFAAKGMSRSVADYDFQASYSGARGELLVLWLRVMTMRFDITSIRENEIFRMWLWGEIDNGNVPDFGYSTDEFIQDAFSNCDWNGPSRPDIDPMRSASAHKIESENGWKTDEQISAERGGGSFDDNIERKTAENIKKAKANEPLMIQEKTTYSNSVAKTESTSTTMTEA